jgi:tetratricopeptide (TPR) repeat protein
VSNTLKLLLLILLVKPSLGFGQQDTASKFDSLVRTAQQAQAANDYTAAVNAYQQAVRMQPNMAELWANLGLMQQQAGDIPAAMQSFLHANRLNPSLYVPNLFIGIDDVQTGHAKDAIPFLLKAEKSNTSDPQPPLALGRAFTSLGKFSSATHELTRVVSLDPKQSSAWFALGIAHLDQMEEDSRKMSEQHQDSPYAKALFAESLDKQARYNQAIDMFRNVMDLKPQPPCLHSELGWSLLKRANVPEAAAEFKADREASPQCGLAILGQAQISIAQDSNQEAMKLLEQLWNRDHGFVLANIAILADGLSADRLADFSASLDQQKETLPPELYSALSSAMHGSPQEAPITKYMSKPSTAEAATAMRGTAESYYASGRFQQCSDRLNSSIAEHQADRLLLLATCSFFTGDYERSVQASAALTALAPTSAAALYWSIKANERLAFSSLNRFEELEPDSTRSHILLGDIYRQRNVMDSALDEYRKALAITPNDPAAMLGLASAYLGNDDLDKTIETVDAALPRSPEDPQLNLLKAEALVAKRDFAAAEPFLLKSLKAKPQMLPHVHALLGKVYAEAGKTQDAIAQLKMGAESDEDGSVHYQLAQLYREAGDSKSSSEALEQVKLIRKQRRTRPAPAVEDPHPAPLEDGPQ